MRDEIIKNYTLNGVTVTWKPALCQHSGICFQGLPKVFDPRRRPWIELQHADREVVIAQVKACPSGALSWTKADDKTSS